MGRLSVQLLGALLQEEQRHERLALRGDAHLREALGLHLHRLGSRTHGRACAPPPHTQNNYTVLRISRGMASLNDHK